MEVKYNLFLLELLNRKHNYTFEGGEVMGLRDNTLQDKLKL